MTDKLTLREQKQFKKALRAAEQKLNRGLAPLPRRSRGYNYTGGFSDGGDWDEGDAADTGIFETQG